MFQELVRLHMKKVQKHLGALKQQFFLCISLYTFFNKMFFFKFLIYIFSCGVSTLFDLFALLGTRYKCVVHYLISNRKDKKRGAVVSIKEMFKYYM